MRAMSVVGTTPPAVMHVMLSMGTTQHVRVGLVPDGMEVLAQHVISRHLMRTTLRLLMPPVLRKVALLARVSLIHMMGPKDVIHVLVEGIQIPTPCHTALNVLLVLFLSQSKQHVLQVPTPYVMIVMVI